jgi:membrane-associated phospholipid phosphatase
LLLTHEVSFSPVRDSEWLALIYFGYMAIVCWFRPLPLARRVQVTAAALATDVLVLIVARRAASVVRNWAPMLYILVGYYVSGWLFVEASPRIEAWLIGWDRHLLGDPTTRFARWPRGLLAYLDIVYMFCFVLVPAGFATLAYSGHAAEADRYWTMVVAAELGSFAPLAIVQTRPPWAVERVARLPDQAVHRLSSQFVRNVTIGVNTFPSGHAAASLAVAIAVAETLRLTGTLFLALAGSIAVASVVGRYHYIVDVGAGILVALLTWTIVWAARI